MHKSLFIICCLCSIRLFGIVTLDRTGKKEAISRSEDVHDLIDQQTAIIRTELPALWDALKVEKMLDAGCGDFYWMRAIGLKQRLYIGVDVAPEMIMTNRSHFGDEQHHFFCLDVTEDPLAQVDMIIYRDVLLDYKKTCAALRNFKTSGSTFLLATTHLSVRENESVTCGHHFPYDLTISPFNLPKPLVLIEETTAEEEALKQKKAMGLWLLQDLDLDCLEY